MTVRLIFVWLFLLLAPSASAAQIWRVTQTFTPVDLGGGQIAVSPDGTRLATVDTSGRYGWNVLLWDMSGHLLRRLDRGTAVSLAFSPDGRWLVVSDGPEQFSRDGKTLLSAGDATFRVWNATTGEQVWSNDSAKYLGRLALWDMQSRKPLWTVPMPAGLVYYGWDETAVVSFSPDDREAAVGSEGGGLLLYDAANGHLIRTVTSRGPCPSGIGILHGLLFSADGSLLIGAGGTGTIREWNVATGAPVASLATPGVQGLTPLPGGRNFLAMVGRDIDVVSAAGLHILKRLRGHDEDVESLALAADGRTLWSAASDGTIKRWNIHTGVCAATYGSIRQAALSPDGKTLAYSLGDSTVTLRDLATGRTLATLTGFARPQRNFSFSGVSKTLVFSPNGRTLAGGAYTVDGMPNESWVFHSRVVVWDVRTRRIVHDWEEDPAAQIAFSPDCRRIALMSPSYSDTPPLIRVRALPSGKVIRDWAPRGRGLDFEVAAVGFNTRDQALLAAEKQISARTVEPGLWNVVTGHLVRTFPGWGAPEALGVSADGKMVAGVNDVQSSTSLVEVHVWNVAAGQLRSAATFKAQPLTELPFGGNKWVAIPAQEPSETNRQSPLLWLVPTVPGRGPVLLSGVSDGVASLSFSADGRVLASVSAYGTVRVWKDEPAK